MKRFRKAQKTLYGQRNFSDHLLLYNRQSPIIKRKIRVGESYFPFLLYLQIFISLFFMDRLLYFVILKDGISIFIYEVENGNSIPGGIAIIDICNFCEIAPANLLGKYLDTNIYTATELTNTNFQRLSNR